MLGAIVGDLAGSIYEYEECVSKQINLNRRLEILNKANVIDSRSFYSDDTILTISILKSILTNTSYEESLKKYGLEYFDKIPDYDGKYFKYMFSQGFIDWCNGLSEGKSIGNGALMRISPVAYLFDTLDRVLDETVLATIPSHNSELAIESAKTVSSVIYYARSGLNKEEIKKIVFPQSKLTVYDLQRTNTFDSTCNILDNCLCVLFESQNFEEAIKKAVSIGGDTDTTACIVGSMAEAIYGIPDNLKNDCYAKLPGEFIDLLEVGYQKVKKLNN